MIRKSLVILFMGLVLLANSQPKSVNLFDALNKVNLPDSLLFKHDIHSSAVLLHGVEHSWLSSGFGKWFEYLKNTLDSWINEKGDFLFNSTFTSFNSNYPIGSMFLTAYRVTGRDKYKKAADQIYAQLNSLTKLEDSFYFTSRQVHYQLGLEGLYFTQPFKAEYAMLFHRDSVYADVAHQFIHTDSFLRAQREEYFYYGTKSSKKFSHLNIRKDYDYQESFFRFNFFGMAIVDVLDFIPDSFSKKGELVNILNLFASSVFKYYQYQNSPLLESKKIFDSTLPRYDNLAYQLSIYTLGKSLRMGYLSNVNTRDAIRYIAMSKQKIKENNLFDISSINAIPSNKELKSNDFISYKNESIFKKHSNVLQLGIGMICAHEYGLQYQNSIGKRKQILLDAYFNNEWKNDATGRQIRWHYTWDDRSNGGFYFLGNIFKNNGATISTLPFAPSFKNLSQASIYIIVDPDTDKETSNPNYMQSTYVDGIKKWVKNGGVLVMLTNDIGNCELDKFNQLSSSFGILFNMDKQNIVIQDQFEQGEVLISTGNDIFKHTKKIFIKELSSITVKHPAKSVVQKDGYTLVATAKFGKGWVFALGDPWLYNEYLDGRKLPSEYQNYLAAEELVQWLLIHSKIKMGKVL